MAAKIIVPKRFLQQKFVTFSQWKLVPSIRYESIFLMHLFLCLINHRQLQFDQHQQVLHSFNLSLRQKKDNESNKKGSWWREICWGSICSLLSFFLHYFLELLDPLRYNFVINLISALDSQKFSIYGFNYSRMIQFLNFWQKDTWQFVGNKYLSVNNINW